MEKKVTIDVPSIESIKSIKTQIVDGKIEVSYETGIDFSKLVKGNVYVVTTKLGNTFINIFKGINEGTYYGYVSLWGNRCSIIYGEDLIYINNIVNILPATQYEIDLLMNQLKKEGKVWNKYKMCVEDIFNPKDGDFLVSKAGSIFIYKPSLYHDTHYGCYCGTFITDDNLNLDISEDWACIEGCRYATKAEKQTFLTRLKEEENLVWNAEKKCLEKYIWKPKDGEDYYYISIDLKVYSTTYHSDSTTDSIITSVNNCFQTEEEAQKYAEEFIEILKNR